MKITNTPSSSSKVPMRHPRPTPEWFAGLPEEQRSQALRATKLYRKAVNGELEELLGRVKEDPSRTLWDNDFEDADEPLKTIRQAPSEDVASSLIVFAEINKELWTAKVMDMIETLLPEVARSERERCGMTLIQWKKHGEITEELWEKTVGGMTVEEIEDDANFQFLHERMKQHARAAYICNEVLKRTRVEY